MSSFLHPSSERRQVVSRSGLLYQVEIRPCLSYDQYVFYAPDGEELEVFHSEGYGENELMFQEEGLVFFTGQTVYDAFEAKTFYAR